MYVGEDNLQVVLRCPQCNKPFDKESTLKRHGYYCRSRRVGSSTRIRSCTSCIKRKARCDSKRPQCSRCMARGLECLYATNASKGSDANIQVGHDTTSSNQREEEASIVAKVSAVENHAKARHDLDFVLDDTLLTSDLVNLETDILDWDDPSFDFAGFLDPQKNIETIPRDPTNLSSFGEGSPPLKHTIIQTGQRSLPFWMSIPASPRDNVRSLTQRPSKTDVRHRITRLMLHTLKSYPLMMLRNQNLPPFVHPHTIASSIGNDDMESLNNCISLLHMISGQSKGNRKLFWTNVRRECERMQWELSDLNKWALISAMQALIVYVLVRIDEGESEHNNVDFLLLTTVMAVAKQVNEFDVRGNTPLIQHDQSLRRRWEDWIAEETTRRLCVAYQSVNMLVHFEPAAMCNLQKELVIAPLPSSRQLWEATDELKWKAQVEREPVGQTDFGLAVNGDLVQFDDKELDCSAPTNYHDSKMTSWKTANWEEWCSVMDGFGGLVMLAASLMSE